MPTRVGRARTAVLVLLAGAAVLAGPASPAQACDCAEGTPAGHYADAEVVFTGSLLSRTVPEPLRSSTDPAIHLFAVDRALKGEVPERAEVRSPVSGASCGLELTGGGPFVVFAGDAGTHLSAQLCGGTAELTPSLERDLDALADGSGTVVAGRGPLPAAWWPTPALLAGSLGLLVLAPLLWRVLHRAR